MKRNLLLIAIFLVFFSFKGLTQEVRQKYIIAEYGIDILGNELLFKDNIRGDVPNYFNMGEPADNLQHLFIKNYTGLKYEIFSRNRKFGFASGIRYTQIHALLGKDPYSGSSANFFYLLYARTGVTTEYLRIRRIEQKSSYLGVPMEMRYFAFNLGPFMGYLKASIEFDYKIQTKTNVRFQNDSMNSYQDGVAKMAGKPRLLTSVLYASTGIRWGNPSKIFVNMEINLPTVFLLKESEGLVNPQAGSGVQISVQIPLKSTKQ